MTDNEKLALIAHTVKYCAGRCKIIAGTGTNDTGSHLAVEPCRCVYGRGRRAAGDTLYNKCTQAGLIAHYTAAADTVPCPVIVYNVPSRTGVDVSVETCRALCAHPNIGGIKEASGSVPKAMRILDACAEELPLWSGNDDLTVPLMAVGARGAISVLSNVRPKLTLQMVRACQTGEYAQAGTDPDGADGACRRAFLRGQPDSREAGAGAGGHSGRSAAFAADALERFASARFGTDAVRHAGAIKHKVHHNFFEIESAKSYSHCQQICQHANFPHISTNTRLFAQYLSGAKNEELSRHNARILLT